MSCVAVALFASSLSGCGGPDGAADRHFARLLEQVSRTEADQDRVALDTETQQDHDARGSSSTPVNRRPVVQLGAADDVEPADPEEPGERPDLRITGSNTGSARTRSAKSGSTLDPEAKANYEAALELVQKKHYGRALSGFLAFLSRWPDHPYAENATYWSGEAYFGQGEYARAASQFEAVLSGFASGKKTSDALLKAGMCHERLGAPARAREYWNRLEAEYPKSDAAKRIAAVAGRENSPKGLKENR
jgi:tol-pal system protein YbgF